MATSRIKKGRLNHSQRIAPYLFILPAMLFNGCFNALSNLFIPYI